MMIFLDLIQTQDLFKILNRRFDSYVCVYLERTDNKSSNIQINYFGGFTQAMGLLAWGMFSIGNGKMFTDNCKNCNQLIESSFKFCPICGVEK